jgi:O-methyltransferase
VTYSAERKSLILGGNLDTMAYLAAACPPGVFVEVGVYRGGSARVLYAVAEAQGRQLYLFDTFTGHPAPSVYDDPRHPEGRYADCADPLALAVELPKAVIIRGRFPDMLPPYFNTVAFAHIDVDLYESTRDAILALAPVMVPSGILYLDDYGVPECPGATKAVDELLPARELLPNGRAIWRRL